MFSKMEQGKTNGNNHKHPQPAIPPRDLSNYPLGAKPHLCKKHYDQYEQSLRSQNGRIHQQNVTTYPLEHFVRMDTFSSKKYKHVCHGCHKTFTYYKSLHSMPLVDPIYSNIPPPNCKHSKPTKSMYLPQDDDNNGYTPMGPWKTPNGSELFEPAYKRDTKEGTLQLNLHASRFNIEDVNDIPPAKDQLEVIIGLLKDIKEQDRIGGPKYVSTRSRSQGWIPDRSALKHSPVRAPRVTFCDEIYKNKIGGKPMASGSRKSREMGDARPSSSHQAPPSPLSDDSQTCTCTWLEALNSLNKYVKDLQAENAKKIQNQFKKLSMYMQPKETKENEAQKAAQKRPKKHGYDKLEHTL